MAGFVTVACKIPNGLVLQLEKREMTVEPSPAGGREVEVGRKIGEPVNINGCAMALTGQPPKHQIIGGYGLTVIAKDFWDHWLKQNETLDAVKNKLLFAYEKRDTTEGKARELKGNRSNMEPLDTDGRNADKSPRDPRMLRGIKKMEENDINAEA